MTGKELYLKKIRGLSSRKVINICLLTPYLTHRKTSVTLPKEYIREILQFNGIIVQQQHDRAKLMEDNFWQGHLCSCILHV